MREPHAANEPSTTEHRRVSGEPMIAGSGIAPVSAARQ